MEKGEEKMSSVGIASRIRRDRTAVCAVLILLFMLSPFSGCASAEVTDAESDKTASAQPMDVRFSHLSGTYAESGLRLTLTAPKGYTVAYTTDSSLPSLEDDSGKNTVTIDLGQDTRGHLAAHADKMVIPIKEKVTPMYDDPTLPFGCVIRAAAVGPKRETGSVRTEVYFLGLDFDRMYPGCLVLSIVTDPDGLLSYDMGILASGAVYDEWLQTDEAKELTAEGKFWEYQANFTQHGKEWERPCVLQIYDSGSRPTVRTEAGIRVTGHVARFMNQKPFNVYFRNEYGEKYLKYELFEGIGRYRSFQLRNGGNCNEWLHFRGAMLQELASGRAFGTVRSRPAVLFLNGEYWGPYALSEKITDEMLKDHYAVDPDQVVVIKQGELEEGKDGDLELYTDLMSYATKDLTDDAVWKDFCGIMNIRSFAEYCAARIYLGDFDWNTKANDVLWRTRDSSYDGGRWQYIFYDAEYSSGLYDNEQTAPDTDHFHNALKNYPLFAAAMKNPEFRTLFLESIRDMGSSCFASEHVEETLQEYLDVCAPLMPDFYRRFGDTSNQWEKDLNSIRHFFEARYDYIVPIVADYDKRKFKQAGEP